MNRRSLGHLIAPSSLLLALAIRLIGIIDVPPGFSGDEAIKGSGALKVLRGHTPTFFKDNYGREAGLLCSMALTIKVLGANVLATRPPAIACGGAGVLFTHVLAHRLWHDRVAILSAALSHPYSRHFETIRNQLSWPRLPARD